MSTTTKPRPAPNGAPGASAPPEANYRVNPEVEAKIDAYIKENPKHWTYLQGMPRDRLERTVVLNEVRQLDRQQRMREGMMERINANPKLKQAYETLVKDVPEEQREEVMSQIARQTQRAVSRSQGQRQTKGDAASVGDLRFRVNVEALKSVQPADLPATEIDVRLGATWLPEQDVEKFVHELLGVSSGVQVSHVHAVGSWHITAGLEQISASASSLVLNYPCTLHTTAKSN